jgi:hypothetical protein
MTAKIFYVTICVTKYCFAIFAQTDFDWLMMKVIIRFMIKTLSEQLRKAISNSGKSVYRIAKDCEIAEPHLHLFLRGQKGLGLDNIDRLGDYLCLELRKKSGKKRKHA